MSDIGITRANSAVHPEGMGVCGGGGGGGGGSSRGAVSGEASQVPRTPSADHLRRREREKRGSKKEGEREEGRVVPKTKHKNLRPQVSQGSIHIPRR